MIDIERLRAHPQDIERAVRSKGVTDVDVTQILTVDTEWRARQKDVEQERHELTTASTVVSTLSGKEKEESIVQLKKRKRALAKKESALDSLTRTREALLLRIPNIPLEDVPRGSDASGNVVLRTVGTPPSFSFSPKEHWEIGSKLGIIDTTRAAKVSGSRFAYLKGDGALLQYALLALAHGVLTKQQSLHEIIQQAGLNISDTAFIPVVPPVLVREETLARMARLEPRDERYHIVKDNMYLVGSAEHALGPMYMEETLDGEDLPRRYIGFSSAFRREAGSYGKDVHGILRMHQFEKIEMESFSTLEQSLGEHALFIAIQEHLTKLLGLPYRVVLMCTGDMGAPNARQVDIETWFPGQQQYRETHTADYMTDYQARRLRIKVRLRDGTAHYAYMNDATVFAIGRTIAAILENYQQSDGSVQIPHALRPYIGNKETLTSVS